MSKLWTVLVVSCVAALTLVVASNVLSQNLGKAPLPPVICEGGACPEPTDMGLEASNARFIGAGGSDTNSGLTHTERWATIGRLNAETLPQGTDVYFLTDSDLDDDTIFEIRHDGDGVSDPVVVDTYCLNDANKPIPYDRNLAVCGERAVITGVSAFGAGLDHYRYGKFKIAGHVSGAIMPWHPGWYMLVRSSRSSNKPEDINVRRNLWYDHPSFRDQDEVQGAVLYLNWVEVEPRKNDYGSPEDPTYGIGYLQAEVAKLRSLNKRFWIRMDDACFNAWNNPWKCFPSYAIQEGFIGGFERTTAVRMWDGGARDRWLKMLAKIDEAVGRDPYFEGISINKETTVGRCENPSQITSGEIKRIPGIVYCEDQDPIHSQASREAAFIDLQNRTEDMFANSSKILAINGLRVDRIERILSNGMLRGIGLGAPDGSPRCTPHTRAGGEPGDCVSPDADYASQENQQYPPYRLMAQPPASHTYEGKFPIHYSVEGSVLGVQNYVRERTGTSPALLHKWFSEVVKPSHLSLTHKRDAATNTQAQWVWDKSITSKNSIDFYVLEDLIQQYPLSTWNPVGIACPESHRNLCWTDTD